MDRDNSNELLFMQLVMQNQQIAMMSLGRMNNPVTNKIEVNLEYAKMAIDTLDMLKERTRGNLSQYEEQFLDETLKELKLIYVAENDKK
ncbi:MAG TPA: DUF1844 domain-containing protein [Ignavibacteriaceae bacterium]|jgi:hypothetical protein|nr:DUF1844 domain-containing protein [Ignavibacteriaceae bacterium]